MIEDARAKIRLADGREVWRHVYIRYREVKTGRWLSSSEMERLWMREVQAPVKTDDKAEQIRNKIVDVQAEIAMDKAGGSKSTSAARVVLKALDELAEKDEDEQVEPWFILGRQLAEQILILVEEETVETR